MDNRKAWTSQQTVLRNVLSSSVHFEQAIPLFLQQHAAVHSASISGKQTWSLLDEALADLTDAQICARPPHGVNSIAWLLWHTTRIEDISMNCLVFEQEQVLLRDTWSDKLGITTRDVGYGMDENEVTTLSQQISVQALKEYRTAVGRSTRAGVTHLTAEQLKKIVTAADLQPLLADGSISAKGIHLAEFYTNRQKGFFLTRTATSHNFQHISEAWRIRQQVLQPAHPRQ
jgi:hypothetical protein